MIQIKDFPNYSITKNGVVFTKRRPRVAGGVLKSFVSSSGRKLAKIFGVSQSQIKRIVNNMSWKYLRV